MRSEREAVRELGEAIGYGRTMQLCEELWGDNLETRGVGRGGAHSAGCCVAFLVPCECADQPGTACDWCCGALRVTKRVREAQRAASAIGTPRPKRRITLDELEDGTFAAVVETGDSPSAMGMRLDDAAHALSFVHAELYGQAPTPSAREGGCAHARCTTVCGLVPIVEYTAAHGPDHRIAEITIRCEDCGAHALWQGLGGGLAPDVPRLSFDARELRAPIVFADGSEA